MAPSRASSRMENRINKRAVRQPLMSVKELAELLQVSVKTIYDWRYRGLGPTAIRVGRHVRYDPGEVERWLVVQRNNSWNVQSSH
jgi:excisionase family DNA binding protein